MGATSKAPSGLRKRLQAIGLRPKMGFLLECRANRAGSVLSRPPDYLHGELVILVTVRAIGTAALEL